MHDEKSDAAFLEGGGKFGGGEFAGRVGILEEFTAAEDINRVFLFVGDLPHQSSFAHPYIVGERFVMEFKVESSFPFFHAVAVGGVENFDMSGFGFFLSLLGVCDWEAEKKEDRNE